MKLAVTLPHHSYDIIIQAGSLKNIGKWVGDLWEKQKILVLTDKNVAKEYLDQVEKSLKDAGFSIGSYVVEPGEKSKSLETASKIYDFLSKEGFTRSDGIIALGGGVVGDLAGFVASTYMRGIHFLQLPTSLLAQVDSSVGGKTGLNTQTAKNLIGTFAQPDGVLIDPETLKTLEKPRIRDGIAEIIKTAAVGDEILWNQLEEMKYEKDLLQHVEEIILACCKVKRDIVQEDELDYGIRLHLNFGHTIGHALEKISGFDSLTHGEGVAIGMNQITKISEEKGLTKEGTWLVLSQMIEKFGLPLIPPKWPVEKIYQAISLDKKTRGEMLKLVVLEDIGKAKIHSIAREKVMEYLE